MNGAVIEIFIGTPSDFDGELLLAEIKMKGKEIVFYDSDDDISSIGADSFLDLLGKAINESVIVARELGLDIIFHESIEEFAEEIEDGLFKKAFNLLKQTE